MDELYGIGQTPGNIEGTIWGFLGDHLGMLWGVHQIIEIKFFSRTDISKYLIQDNISDVEWTRNF